MSKTLILSLFMLLMVVFPSPSFASPHAQSLFLNPGDTLFVSDTAVLNLAGKEGISLIPDTQTDPSKKKKLISAMLAFPFPFGFMGAHRVMLGCKPWVPVVYVATFGGCFGILPMIDFCVILLSKDIQQYENNPHVFMWLK